MMIRDMFADDINRKIKELRDFGRTYEKGDC